ncbi:hypothetical protein Cgig2_025530 [Carnegiea gigantea]|uniref:Uncharacterized protein n=1 Tax=Carnegiea gigantea TaxID=171969 RepID=A0A9Q1K9R4_9CARY|nr:hypothetical protein Cgig2_025530 [Carnegiea gigantea]
MNLNIPAMAAKLRKRKQAIVEDDEEEDNEGEIRDYYYSDSDDDVGQLRGDMDAKAISDTALKNYLGVIYALKECLPDCLRRVCVVHLERNLKRKFPSPELKILLWKAANTYNIWDNKEALHQLQEASSAAYAWLTKEPKEHWGRPGPIAKDRVRGPEEGIKKLTRSRTVRCSTCNGLHHNVATCTGQGNQPSTRVRKKAAPFDRTRQKCRGRLRKQPPLTTVSQSSSSHPSLAQPCSSQPSLTQPSSTQSMLGN